MSQGENDESDISLEADVCAALNAALEAVGLGGAVEVSTEGSRLILTRTNPLAPETGLKITSANQVASDGLGFEVDQTTAGSATIPRNYRITFSADVGKTIGVGPDDAEYVVNPGSFSRQPTVVPVGNINGVDADNVERDDFIVAVQNNFSDLSSDFDGSFGGNYLQSSYAFVHLGTAGTTDVTLDNNSLVFKLPAPLNEESIYGTTTVLGSPGDFNGDGIDDLAFAVFRSDASTDETGERWPFINQGVYVVFGESGDWSGEVDVVNDADVVIKGVAGGMSVASAGDFTADGIDDLLIGDQATGIVYLFNGRPTEEWPASTISRDLYRADFNDRGGVGVDDGFVIDNIGAPSAGRWHLTERRGRDDGHTGLQSFYFGRETEGDYDVGGQTAGSITSPTTDLRNVNNAQLSFTYLLQTEGNPDKFDQAQVDISTDGGTSWQVLPGATNNELLIDTGTDNGDPIWNSATFDLSEYAGQQIQIRFKFDSIDGVNNSHEGWYVDDVAVTTSAFLDTASAVFSFVNGSPGFLGLSDVSGIGDYNGDGNNDVAIAYQDDALESTQVSILRGGKALVADINQNETGLVVSRDQIPVAGTLYFAADDRIHGSELWVSDGTAAGTRLVRDLNPGSASSKPSHFVSAGSTAVFVADDGINGLQVWRSDGTFEGTWRIANVVPEQEWATEISIVAFDGSVYFIASVGSYQFGMWRVSPNERDAQFVTYFTAGAFKELELVAGKERMYINGGDAIWTSDGTAEGTVALPNTAWSTNLFEATDGTLYYTSNDAIWKLDENSSPVNLTPSGYGSISFRGTQWTEAAGKIFFEGTERLIDSSRTELWLTDGTSQGTLPLTVSQSYNPPVELKSFDGQLFFASYTSELWKSDGSQEGTVVVKDFEGWFSLRDFVVFDGKLFFLANTDTDGFALWSSDGTAGGTSVVKMFNDKLQDFYLFESVRLTASDERLYISTIEDGLGRQLWVSDGKEIGTERITSYDLGTGGTSLRSIISFNNQLVFTGKNPNNDGSDIVWTVLDDVEGLETLRTSPGTTSFPAFELTATNDQRFYGGFHNGIFVSDGTVEGTHVLNGDMQPFDLVNWEDVLFVSGYDFDSGEYGIWRSDGMLGIETEKIFSSMYPVEVVSSGTEGVYFVNGDMGSYKELWITDGTPNGQTKLTSFDSADRLGGHLDSPQNENGSLYFYAAPNYSEAAIWTSDGTKQGTKRISDYIYHNGIVNLSASPAGTVYFSAQSGDGLAGIELWKTSGLGTTELVKDINAGIADSNPEMITTVGAHVFFSAEDDLHGRELWVSEG
ncbi:MAG: choice-of-anchor J domain-containing protein, partial [Planctomycetales bacterium]|nr:choice-of-anchor J domain-containing protein [Planctomycetales bacterium]